MLPYQTSFIEAQHGDDVTHPLTKLVYPIVTPELATWGRCVEIKGFGPLVVHDRRMVDRRRVVRAYLGVKLMA